MIGPTVVFAIAVAVAIASLVVLASLGIRRWLFKSAEFDFEPELNITRKNGWALIDLVLVNHSQIPVWAEAATFALAELDADFQGAPPSEQCTLLLRETVRPGETLRVSLIETVYNCAGKPQGQYSFLISGTVRYRAEDSWFEIGLQTYRVRMVALSAVRLLRMRWYDQPAKAGSGRSRLRKLSGSDQDCEQRL